MQPTVALGMSLLPFQTTWGMELYSPRKSIFELVIIQKISGGSWLIGRSYFPANQKWPLEFIDLIELSSSFQNCLNIDEGSFIFIRFFVRSRQNCWSTCNTILEMRRIYRNQHYMDHRVNRHAASFQNYLNIAEDSFIFIRFFVRSRQNCWSTWNTILEWDEYIQYWIIWKFISLESNITACTRISSKIAILAVSPPLSRV